MLLLSGEYEDAAKFYLNAANLRSSCFWFYDNAAVSYEKSDVIKSKHLLKVLETHPSSELAINGLSRINNIY